MKIEDHLGVGISEPFSTSNHKIVEAKLAGLNKFVDIAKGKLRELHEESKEQNPHLRVTFDGNLTSKDLGSLYLEKGMEAGWDFYPEDRTFYFESDQEAKEFFDQVCPKLSVSCSIGYPTERKADSES